MNNFKLVGIFGYPLTHTLSPYMHNAAFRHLKLPFCYIPFAVKPEQLKEAVNSIRVLHITGVNITIPHKEHVMQYLDKIDPLAKRIGSVNTIVNTDGVLTGHNTDGKGFLQDFADHKVSVKNKTVLLIGGGGAGKAIAATLSFSGAKRIYIADSNETRAQSLVKKYAHTVFSPLRDIGPLALDVDILINATPLGMHTGDPSPVPAGYLARKTFVYDVVYNRKTPLLASAEKIKAKNSGGIGMLLHQGALAFELWTKHKAPVSIMKKALIEAAHS